MAKTIKGNFQAESRHTVGKPGAMVQGIRMSTSGGQKLYLEGDGLFEMLEGSKGLKITIEAISGKTKATPKTDDE